MKILQGLIAISLLTSCVNTEFTSGGSKRKPKPFEPKTAISTHTQTFFQTKSIVQQKSAQFGATSVVKSHEFSQPHNKLDILVIIDDSTSMELEQKKLGSKLSSLLSAIEHTDWQIAVVTTLAKTDECFRDLIRKSDAFASDKFFQAVGNAGIHAGHGNEQGLKNSLRGLQAQCKGQTPWLRDNAAIAVLIVSDEDNCSNKESNHCTEAERKAQVSDVYSFAKSIRTIGENIRYYGIIHRPEDKGACEEPTDGNQSIGEYYAEVIHGFKGISGSICAKDYSPILKQISQDMTSLLIADVDLSDTPLDNSVEVKVNKLPWNAFLLDQKKVTFTQIPPVGAKVQITYKVAIESQKPATIPLEPNTDIQSIRVTINGAEASQGDFSWHEDTKALHINTPLDSNLDVSVSYQLMVTLLNTFKLDHKPLDKSWQLSVGGAPFESQVTLDGSINSLVLNPPPPQDSQLVIKYDYLKANQ